MFKLAFVRRPGASFFVLEVDADAVLARWVLVEWVPVRATDHGAARGQGSKAGLPTLDLGCVELLVLPIFDGGGES